MRARSHGARLPASPSRCASTWGPPSRSRQPGSAGAPLVFTELDEDGRPQEIAARPERWGDAVIVRKDVPTSYHLAVVVDDAWQGVTHVTRGRDLYAATDLHRLLQVLLDLPAPIYQHHRLDHGRARPQARQERPRHQSAIAARERRNAGRRPPHGRAGMSSLGLVRSAPRAQRTTEP